MSYYRRVEIIDGETTEPVQFVGVYTLNWPEGYTPEAAFVEAEDVEAKLQAAEALALAYKDGAKFIAKYAADTGSVLAQRALDRMNAALHQYREAQDG